MPGVEPYTRRSTLFTRGLMSKEAFERSTAPGGMHRRLTAMTGK